MKRTAGLIRALVGLACAGGLAAGLLLSCSAGNPELLPRKDLFNLRLGKLEDAVDLFQLGGLKSERKNRLYMRNGIFLLSNGNSNKIMEFSSYGDLLTLLYNPQDNAKPIFSPSDSGAGRISNKQVVPYTFQETGEVAVTRSGLLLVEDRAPQARSVRDPQLGARLSNVILRFNNKRQYMDYLGQEGIGGSPLPYVQALHVTTNDDIVVVCKTTRQWLVFWYNLQGVRKYAVAIDLAHLPMPAKGSPLIPSLSALKPDPEMPVLYLAVDYYPNASVQGGSGPGAGGEPARIESRIYTLNLSSNSYDTYFSLPYESQQLPGASEFEPRSVQSLHVFLGVTIGGNFLFTSHMANDRYLLSILDRNGRVLNKRSLAIEDSRLVDRSLNLSFDGVLSAFLGYEDHAAIVWWRTDSLSGRPSAFN